MTAQQSLKNKKHIVTPRYIGYTLTHGWAMIMLAFIVLFFTITIPTVIAFQDARNTLEENYLISGEALTAEIEEEYMSSLAEEVFGSIFAFVLVEAFAFGLFAGMHSTSFLHDKTAAGFYHSLPERRSGHYIASLVSALSVFILPLLLNTVFAALICAACGAMTETAVTYILKILLIGALYYIYSVAAAFLASMLTGTRVMSLIVSLFITNALPVLYFAVTYLMNVRLDYLTTSFWDLPFFCCIYPYARAYYLATAESYGAYAAKLIIIDVILTAVLFILSYIAYKKRPIERAGTTIIYKWASNIVKYCVMFVIALIFAELFSSIGDGGVWVIFGLASGLILSLMLSNTILNRSVKTMFSGLKGFAVFAVCFLALYIGSYAGMFGWLDYVVPVSDNITVELGWIEYSFEGEEADELRGILADFVKTIDEYDAYDDTEYAEAYEVYDDYISTVYFEGATSEDGFEEEALQSSAAYYLTNQSGYMYLNVTYGDTSDESLHLTYSYGSFTSGKLLEIVEFLMENANYGVGESTVHEITRMAYYTLDFYVSKSMISECEAFEELIEEYDELTEEILSGARISMSFYPKTSGEEFTFDFKLKQEPSIGYFYLHANNSSGNMRSNNFPLYVSDMEELTEFFSDDELFIMQADLETQYGGYYTIVEYDSNSSWKEPFIEIMEAVTEGFSLEEYSAELASSYDYAYVYNKTTKTGEYVTGDDLSELLTCLKRTSYISDASGSSQATASDDNYAVIVVYKYKTYRGEEVSTLFITSFLGGMVPDFIE
ncbi:MAG: hypothetical protein LUH43_02295 [Clostridia bacterium]|nr:hypothetical protein [Clostridia bacterium]